tara:strand:- start:184 stop:306 length:123 start_codon:yes stop_codon:yes gene_type:complete
MVAWQENFSNYLEAENKPAYGGWGMFGYGDDADKLQQGAA